LDRRGTPLNRRQFLVATAALAAIPLTGTVNARTLLDDINRICAPYLKGRQITHYEVKR
jgi:hypothetical protein